MSLIAPAAVVDVAVAAASGGTVSLCLLLPRCHRFDVFDAASGGTVLMWLMLLPVVTATATLPIHQFLLQAVFFSLRALPIHQFSLSVTVLPVYLFIAFLYELHVNQSTNLSLSLSLSLYRTWE